jgi:malto-oligosyltrehalose trehalohydrolase
MGIHTMPFGAELQPNGNVRFRLYAPAAETVRLVLNEESPNTAEPLIMQAFGDGWHELVTSAARAGSRYRFVLPDGFRVPDPASRFQSVGVHGPSEVIDPATFRWTDDSWHGRRWEEAVLYELHVGAFTQEGTFRAAVEKLDHLVELGVTAIELMSVAAFAGQRNWGYDSVLLFAPNSTYGRPEDLKMFVDAAHARGLAVVLDVVYNHFGPEGNYLPRYFPQIFSTKHKTAWGPGLNFDGPGNQQVRELIIHNALYWVEEFHIDGLRLDASHALLDDSPCPILDELAERVRAGAGDRLVHLILEDEKNMDRLLRRKPDGSEIGYTAQWNHSSDHLLGLAMSGGCDPQDENIRHQTLELGAALAQGFVPGGPGHVPAEAEAPAPPDAFISFIQTHDLVGNRVFGERIHALASPEAVRAIAAIYLLLPQIPMLFMGEEWATDTPFPFFSDYGGELGEAVRRGRYAQLLKTGQLKQGEEDRAPDPQAESTFRSAKLNWSELADPGHAAHLDWYKRILAVRRERVAPLLAGLTGGCGQFRQDGPGQFSVDWELAGGSRLSLAANLCARPSGAFPAPLPTLLWLEGAQSDDATLGAWTVRWSHRS